MNVEELVRRTGADFFTGVPDSQLNALCSYLYDRYGVSGQHIIAANEGNAAAIAAGYHLATGKVPVVYLQNSGLGNLVNPVASLMHHSIYGIPCLFFVGWRGEPGIQDEPQHGFQGEITIELLQGLEIPAFVIDKCVTLEQVSAQLEAYRRLFAQGRQAALVIRKGALEYKRKDAVHQGALRREAVIASILDHTGSKDVIVSTTGRTSRELFELRERRGEGHDRDFLTVGSMGHSSSIALGIALEKPGRRVWCIDGDGAALMHMGAMAVIAAQAPANLVHIVVNNGAHESVGGLPTVANQIDLTGIARSCGYAHVARVSDLEQLHHALKQIVVQTGLTFLEVRTSQGARQNLGRPTKTPLENKTAFMKWLQ